MLTINEIKQVVTAVAANYPINKVSVFGAYADGKATDESNIDLKT
ncbi:MAG: nucleotidyltransferase domain-containing protein [Niameybacter sp.]